VQTLVVIKMQMHPFPLPSPPQSIFSKLLQTEITVD
jgi:hypothetical protein